MDILMFSSEDHAKPHPADQKIRDRIFVFFSQGETMVLKMNGPESQINNTRF